MRRAMRCELTCTTTKTLIKKFQDKVIEMKIKIRKKRLSNSKSTPTEYVHYNGTYD